MKHKDIRSKLYFLLRESELYGKKIGGLEYERKL